MNTGNWFWGLFIYLFSAILRKVRIVRYKVRTVIFSCKSEFISYCVFCFVFPPWNKIIKNVHLRKVIAHFYLTILTLFFFSELCVCISQFWVYISWFWDKNLQLPFLFLIQWQKRASIIYSFIQRLNIQTFPLHACLLNFYLFIHSFIYHMQTALHD